MSLFNTIFIKVEDIGIVMDIIILAKEDIELLLKKGKLFADTEIEEKEIKVIYIE